MSEAERVNLLALTKEVKDFIDKFLSDFWFNFNREITLGKIDDAHKKVLELQGYFPDLDDPYGIKIHKEVNRVNNLLRRR